MFILDRYILKNHIPPYLFSLIIITFVFIMDFIIRYLDMFIDKGVGFFVVLEFFFLSLGHMFALIIPMAVMPATLMAFGQFASEIRALRKTEPYKGKGIRYEGEHVKRKQGKALTGTG